MAKSSKSLVDPNLIRECKLAYISGYGSLKELLNDPRFASISYATVYVLGKREDWKQAREDYHRELEKKAREKMLEIEKDKVASRTLRHLKVAKVIQRMALTNLSKWYERSKQAPVMEPKDAAKIGIESVKLERLIFGDATSTVHVKEVHYVMERIIAIIGEVVPADKLGEIQQRILNLMPEEMKEAQVEDIREAETA